MKKRRVEPASRLRGGSHSVGEKADKVVSKKQREEMTEAEPDGNGLKRE